MQSLKQLLTKLTTHKDRYIKGNSMQLLKRLQEIGEDINNL